MNQYLYIMEKEIQNDLKEAIADILSARMTVEAFGMTKDSDDLLNLAKVLREKLELSMKD